MIILKEPVSREQLIHIEEQTFFEDMMKCVADLDLVLCQDLAQIKMRKISL